MDYEPQVASDILDYLFKPGFGLALQMLKVEIGGDTDATEGAESSHMHSATDPGDYTRGYEWWLMTEAKKRNPAIKLYGLSWGFPGWLNANATATAPADPKAVFLDTASMAQTANYTVQWLLGAQREHGLTIDYVGLWNERSPPPEYAPVLRGAVRAAGLAPATTVVGQWPVEHYGGTVFCTLNLLSCLYYRNTINGASIYQDRPRAWT
jgi:galactosylceramidase